MVGGSSSRPLTPESVRFDLSGGTPGRSSSSSSSSRSSSPGGSVGRPFSAPTVVDGERLTPSGTPPFEMRPLSERKIDSISPRSQMTTPTNPPPPPPLGNGEIDVEGGKLLFSSGKDGNLEDAKQDLLSQVSKKEESGEVKKGSTSACKKFFSEMGEVISSVLSNKTFQKTIGVIGLGILIAASAVNPVLILGTVPFLLILTNGFVVEPPPYVPPSNSENKPKKDQQTQLDGNDPIAKDKPLGHANGHSGATGGKSTEELEEASRRDIDSRHRPATRTIGTSTEEISELRRPPNFGEEHFPPSPSLDSHEDEDEEERMIFSRTPSSSPASLNSLEDEDEDEEISTIFSPTPSTFPAPLNSLEDEDEDEEKSTNFSPTPSPSPDYSLETTRDESSWDTPWEVGKESVSTGTLYYSPKFDTNERDDTGLSEFEASPSPSASIRIVHHPSHLAEDGSQDGIVVDIRSEPLHISELDDDSELEQVPAQQPFSLAKPAVVQDQSADSAQDHIIEFARTVSEEAHDKGLTVISIVTPRSEADDVLQNLRIHIEVPAGPEQPLDTESYLKEELLGEHSELKNQLLQAVRDKGVEGTDEQIINWFAKDVQDQVRHISPLYKGDFPDLSTVKSLSHLHDQLKQQRFSEPDPSDWIKVQNILTRDIVNQFVQEALETGSVPRLGSGKNVSFSRELRNKTMMKAMDNVGLPLQNENLEKPINKIGLDYCKKALNFWTEGMTRELSPKE